jgi:spoIIIJ-associated protein
MAEIIGEGKTVNAAIESALKELGCQKEEAQIEIIQEPSKGIFGLSKIAKVKVIYNSFNEANKSKGIEIDKEEINEVTNNIQQVIKQILNLMGILNYKLKINEAADSIYMDIYSDAEGLLIGRHGQTLASFQYLLNRIVLNSNNLNKNIRYIIDIGGYKVRHKIILEKMVKRIVKKVIETNEEEHLKAMSAYDRRIIHLCIKDITNVVSYSVGEGNYRRVVIAPKENSEPKKQ